MVVSGFKGLDPGEISQLTSIAFLSFMKQVIAIVVIDFEVGHRKGDFFLGGRLGPIKEVTDDSWDQSPLMVTVRASGHREGLTRSRLTIGEYGRIEPFEGRIGRFSSDRLEDILLFGRSVEDPIELKSGRVFRVVDESVFGFLGDHGAKRSQFDFGLVLGDGDLFDLLLGRTESEENIDG